VISDPLMLRRILQNLLTNALRYTHRGGVLMGCRRKGGEVQIQVHDTGPGIPEAQRQAIFLEFQRGEAYASDGAGFGLGLSIVRRFATALGHEIRLSSRVGSGSTFSVTLPGTEAAAVAEPCCERQNIDFQYSGLEGAKILLVENDPLSAEAMTMLLERWGCDVAKTGSAAEAIERVGALGVIPDAIIADLHLDANESGLGVVNAIRQQVRSDIPAMIVTADYSAEAARDVAVYGIELLKKPVKPAEIRALLSFLMG